MSICILNNEVYNTIFNGLYASLFDTYLDYATQSFIRSILNLDRTAPVTRDECKLATQKLYEINVLAFETRYGKEGNWPALDLYISSLPSLTEYIKALRSFFYQINDVTVSHVDEINKLIEITHDYLFVLLSTFFWLYTEKK